MSEFDHCLNTEICVEDCVLNATPYIFFLLCTGRAIRKSPTHNSSSIGSTL